MTGVEIDFVVEDSLKALETYEQIFDLERVEVTDFPKGQNEVVFTLYGVRFHMLDANPEYQLAPPGEHPVQSIWFNVLVPDINEMYAKAMQAGCTELIFRIMELPMQFLPIPLVTFGCCTKSMKSKVLKSASSCGRSGVENKSVLW